jgi:hypothetical protein
MLRCLLTKFIWEKRRSGEKKTIIIKTVLGMFLGLPDPDPSVRCIVQLRILPLSHKGVERTKIMLKILTQNLRKKLKFKD